MNNIFKYFVTLVAAGIYYLAFPAIYLWPAAFIAIALLALSIRGSGFWRGALHGVIFFFLFFAFLIYWLTLYLGPVPWIALTVAMTLSGSLALGAIAFIWRSLSQSPLKFHTEILLKALSFSVVWITWEAISSRFPFGGFSWGRFAFSQSESLWTNLFSYIGSAGVGFFLIFLTVTISLSLPKVLLTARQIGVPQAIAFSAVIVIAFSHFLPAFGTKEVGSVRIAAVQGNADASLNAKNPPGTVLNNHMEETQKLIGEEFDLLIWPENASDLDPLRNGLARSAIEYLYREFQVPIVVGTITKTPDEKYYNSVLVWGSDGLEQQYDKIHPVPFAEYMPMREFFMKLAPDLVSLVTRDYEKGSGEPLLTFDGYSAGAAICYDIADDEVMRAASTKDSHIILAPTNNADFGETNQNQQQLAIAKIRALEARKAVVNISTVGTSAIVDANGEEINRLTPYEPGHMLNDVPLYEGQTLAVSLGPVPEIIFGIGTLIFLILAGAYSWPLRFRR